MSVAVISNATGSQGTASALAAGISIITASDMPTGITNSTTITVGAGTHWTVRNSGVTSTLWKVTWAHSLGLLVAVGGDTPNSWGTPPFSGTILTSADNGELWTAETVSLSSPLMDVTWSGTQFVAVGGGGTILSSPDGHVWTLPASGTTNWLNGITWSGTQFVVVGNLGIILTSPDGINWHQQVSGIAGDYTGISSIAWSGTTFVAVGWNNQRLALGEGFALSFLLGMDGFILTSPDGINWTTQVTQLNPIVHRVAWLGSMFVGVGSMGTILTSTDGSIWTNQVTGVGADFYDVAWSGATFVAVGGFVSSSIDGANWIVQMSPQNEFNGILWTGKNFVTVGWGGVVLTSP